MSRTIFADDDIDLDVRFVASTMTTVKNSPLMRTANCGSDGGTCNTDVGSSCTNFCGITRIQDGCTVVGCTGFPQCPQ